jgi:2-oxoglutarate ferredoxin oxidoreductase subunit beta
MNPLGEKYLRKEALPTIFCPGCGHGTVLNATLRMLEKVGLENFLFVSGIGCSSWLPVFIKADVLHTLHGRAVAVATGLKLAQPDKKVMVFNGDGDCLAIGGNHLIHAARRNIDLTVVTLNNYIYGMTGGQVLPGTPLKEQDQNLALRQQRGAFRRREAGHRRRSHLRGPRNTAAPVRIARTLEKAVNHKGFSFVEIMSQCPTQAGRNIYGKAAPGAIMNILKESAVSKADAELQPGQFRTGIIHLDEDSPVYAPVAAPVAV